MASPQVENGHIDIANPIADKFCGYRLSGQEWQVIWVVIRKTWGWNKKMAVIALSQFSAMTGIDRRKCHAILKRLVDRNIIKKSVTQKGNSKTITYGIQKNFDLWEVSPKKAPVTQLGDKVSPKKAHIKTNNTKDNNTPPIPPPRGGVGDDKKSLKKDIEKYLVSKISGTSFTRYESKLLEFVNWRMSLPGRDRFKSTKGIDGLLANVGDLLRAGLEPIECLDIAMREEWLKPKVKYFKEGESSGNFKRKSIHNGFSDRTYEGTPDGEVPWANQDVSASRRVHG